MRTALLIALALVPGTLAQTRGPGRAGARPSRSIRRGRSRCPIDGSSAPSPACTWTRTITSGSSIARRRCSRTKRDRSGVRRRRCWSSIADGNVVSSWGGPGDGYEWPDLEHGIYVDDRARLARRRRREGRADSEVHAPGQVRDADRPQGTEHRQQRHAEPRRRREPDHRSRRQRALRCRRLREPPRHRLRRRHRRVQTPLGRVRQTPDDGYFTQAGEKLPSPFSGAVQHENQPSQYDPNGPPPPQFRIVHAVRIARDGLVYVCDRTNDRLQVFRKDGTFVKEAFVAKTDAGQRLGVGHRLFDRCRRRPT